MYSRLEYFYDTVIARFLCLVRKFSKLFQTIITGLLVHCNRPTFGKFTDNCDFGNLVILLSDDC